MRAPLCARGFASQFEVDVQALVFVAAVLRRKARTADLASVVVFLICRNVVGAPAVGKLDYGKGKCAETIAVLTAFAI